MRQPSQLGPAPQRPNPVENATPRPVTSLLKMITYPLVATFQTRQRTVVRQQVAVLRMELHGLQEAQGQDGSHEERVGRYVSVQALRRSILRAEFAQKQAS